MRRVLAWVEDHAVIFVIVGLLGLFVLAAETRKLTVRIDHDEQRTAVIQKQGVPISVCLIEVLRNVAPLLEKVPSVERPLQAYLTLQSSRYRGKRCPERPGEAEALAKTLKAP